MLVTKNVTTKSGKGVVQARSAWAAIWRAAPRTRRAPKSRYRLRCVLARAARSQPKKFAA
jgi:hypothetical protein